MTARRSFVYFVVAVMLGVFSGLLPAAGPTAGTEIARADYGLSTAKRANCMGCHKWHGDGGPGYGGAAISLRKTQLDREQLIELIKCGRPGTNMPYFDKYAYSQKQCYGLTFDDFADTPDHRPLKGKKVLNERQISAIVDFVIADLQGKELTKAYCEKYFAGPSRQCDLIETP